MKEKNVQDTSPLVLIVDDDPAMRLLEKTALEEADFSVREAVDGIQALEAFHEQLPDAILLDVMMPESDGFSVCEKIRKTADGEFVPIIMVTGLNSANAVARAYEVGATDFLCKPINWSVLGHHLRYILRASNAFKKLKESEVALKISEDRYALAALGANDGLWDWNISDGSIYFSGRWKSLIGYDAKEIGSSVDEWFNRVHSDDIEQLRHDISIHLDGTTSHFQSEYRMCHKDGTYRWMLTRGVTVRDKSGMICRMAGSQTDITERKEADNNIAKSKKRLQTFFDGVTEPMFMTAIDGSIVIANQAAMEFSDYYSFPDIIGKQIKEILSTNYDLDEELTNALRAGLQKSFILKRKRQGLIDRIFIYPILLDNRQIRETIIRIVDITKEKVLEQQLIHTEKLAALGLLVAGIAHEINNPNNCISLNMSGMRKYLDEILPIVDDYALNQSNFVPLNMSYADFRLDLLTLINDVEQSSQRISAIVRELRDFSRKGEIEERTLIAPRGFIERVIAMCNRSAAKGHVKITVVEEDVFPVLNLPAATCEQVLVNLIINAIHASDKAHAYVTVIIKRGLMWTDYLTIIVKDNGKGMDEATRARIFEPFFTLKPRGEGTGLGLYISKMLTNKLGGDITCHSNPNEGSEFTITLPKAILDINGAEGT